MSHFSTITSKLSLSSHFSCYLQVIEMTLRAAEHKAQRLLKEMEEEIAELKKRRTALNQLTLSEDYIHFFKVWKNEWVKRMKQEHRSNRYGAGH